MYYFGKVKLCNKAITKKLSYCGGALRSYPFNLLIAMKIPDLHTLSGWYCAQKSIVKILAAYLSLAQFHGSVVGRRCTQKALSIPQSLTFSAVRSYDAEKREELGVKRDVGSE